jgi:hypothetical protein
MAKLKMTTNRVGFWSSVTLASIGVFYFVTLAVGFSHYGLHEPIGDPVLAVMEVITLLSALPVVCLMAAVASSTAARHQAPLTCSTSVRNSLRGGHEYRSLRRTDCCAPVGWRRDRMAFTCIRSRAARLGSVPRPCAPVRGTGFR